MDLLQIIFPKRCLFCQEVLALDLKREYAPVCSACFEKAPFIVNGCPVCGAPKTGKACACEMENYHFERNISLFVYNEMVAEVIHLLKYKKKREIGTGLGNLMMRNISFPGKFFENIDLITTVPIHKKRMAERGYNQSDLIAAEISKSSGLALNKQLLLRTADTPPLYNLTAPERRAHLSGSFIMDQKNRIDGKVILLVDDIFTTGATLDECAKILSENGAKKIFCITASKTIKKA